MTNKSPHTILAHSPPPPPPSLSLCLPFFLAVSFCYLLRPSLWQHYVNNNVAIAIVVPLVAA